MNIHAKCRSAIPAAMFSLFLSIAGGTLSAQESTIIHELTFCLVCHGYALQGNPSVGAPSLAGIEPWYLDAALDAYRRGLRSDYAAAMDMQAGARMLPAEGLEKVLDLLRGFPAEHGPIPAAARESSGGRAYAENCAACHGAEAEGSEALAAPALRRLDAWYLRSAWQAYRTGGRGGSAAALPAQQMRQYVDSLPDSFDIESIINFITE